MVFSNIVGLPVKKLEFILLDYAHYRAHVLHLVCYGLWENRKTLSQGFNPSNFIWINAPIYFASE